MASESEEPFQSDADGLNEFWILGHPETRRKFIKQVAGTSVALAIGPSLLSSAPVDQADTTIEGLANGDELHPMQAAFIEQDGFQCGYCTPGQICSAVACVQEGHANNDDEIREWMSGNICRCGAYPNILAAIKEAKTKVRT